MDDLVARAHAHEQDEPQVLRDRRALCERRALAELLALVGEVPATESQTGP